MKAAGNEGRFTPYPARVYVLEDPFSDTPLVRNLLAGKLVESGALKGKPLEGGAFLSLDLDFDPCFLPSGRMVFISDRRGGFGRCHPRSVESYTLHGMLRDGSDVIRMTPHP
jgi:hypothetical protein